MVITVDIRSYMGLICRIILSYDLHRAYAIDHLERINPADHNSHTIL